MTEEKKTVAVEAIDIKAGDKVRGLHDVGWDAITDAEQFEDGSVTVNVIHQPDGGPSMRYWADPQQVIEVQRPAGRRGT